MPWKNSNFKQEISILYVNLKESQKKFDVRHAPSSSETLLTQKLCSTEELSRGAPPTSTNPRSVRAELNRKSLCQTPMKNKTVGRILDRPFSAKQLIASKNRPTFLLF